ncbi:MAG TPA: zinc ribbon domain-containing protein [Candidatus Eisenbacteria bacterium]|nr:zinc ribbon domain-containing protein [Candidatus Eisenbacteria bacterium]
MSDAWNEKLRMIRFRRKRERSTFREELRILPNWLVWTCVALSLLALLIGLGVNIHNLGTGGPTFPDDSLRNEPALSCLGLAGVILLTSFMLSCLLLTLGYVYRDARRRGMNGALWTLLVLILAPMYLFIGLVIYLLVRDPLPFTCPQCAASVSARFNFCPSCKYNLHPACPQCQKEVSDGDRFCPYCAMELKPASEAGDVPPARTAS